MKDSEKEHSGHVGEKHVNFADPGNGSRDQTDGDSDSAYSVETGGGKISNSEATSSTSIVAFVAVLATVKW